ncbi:MAG: hydrogenase maturation nickel metallochaperone HypA [Bacteroidales bacterium]
MHELSIALSIVDLAEAESRRHQAKRVTEMEIEVGRLAGVDTEALSFVLESVIRQTPLEGCKILIRSIEGKYQCRDCMHEYPAPDLFSPCPACGSVNRELLNGKELKLKSLIID